MVTARDYTAEAVSAARAVLIELTHLLGRYRGDIVLVGGWVPPLLLGEKSNHVGSMDVDLALDHKKLERGGYASIGRLLTGAGYVQDAEQPFTYRKEVLAASCKLQVQVDLLAGEYEGTGRSRRTQRFQDVRPRKARGCDLAFTAPVEVKVEGRLPSGALDSVSVRVTALGPFIVMKGIALRERLKAKDAYDIYFVLRHAPFDHVVDSIRQLGDHGLLREALDALSEKFASPKHAGPQQVAELFEEHDLEVRDIRTRDAYERVRRRRQAVRLKPSV